MHKGMDVRSRTSRGAVAVKIEPTTAYGGIAPTMFHTIMVS